MPRLEYRADGRGRIVAEDPRGLHPGVRPEVGLDEQQPAIDRATQRADVDEAIKAERQAEVDEILENVPVERGEACVATQDRDAEGAADVL